MEFFAHGKARLTGGYLYGKQKLNENVTIGSVYDRFNETGRIGAFDFAWKEGDDKKPHIFWDSDVAKWMEGAAYVLGDRADKELEDKVEALVDRIEAHQGEDGYFNIYYTVVEPENRFTVRGNHELYCAGHLFEAAVAYAEATGKERFLHCMEKYARYIHKVFVVDKSAKFTTPGHEEIELALLRMYKYTRDPLHLELAKFFLEERGRHEGELDVYNQSEVPIRRLSSARGHAVRAMYLYTAMAEYAEMTGDEELKNTCRTLWRDVTHTKMYVTGGIGSTRIGEAFTNSYDLPNHDAYTETCAAIGLMFFAKRMLTLEPKGEYADVIERAFYNGVLSGLSLDGRRFFYENPLEIMLNERFEDFGLGVRKLPITQRVECFSCSCCPPNLNRLLPCLADYIYSEQDGTLFVHQYAESSLRAGVECDMETDYPREGAVRLSVRGAKRVALRIPAWCESFKLNRTYELKDGYAFVEGDGEIELLLDVSPFLVYADTRVGRNAGRVCVQAGPVVYCAECERPHELAIPQDPVFSKEYDAETGLYALTVDAVRTVRNGALYSRDPGESKPEKLRLIPYSSFANHGEKDMLVWIRNA